MDLHSWNGALLEDVYERGRTGQRLYLYVDRDVLSRLSGLSPAEAVADFCSAIQAMGGRRPFHDAAMRSLRWRLDGYPGRPAFVAHLAMTVLAVTEEPVGGANGIYRRQNELLGLPSTAQCPPGYEDDVPLLWSVWNSWLDGPGAALGRPSARNHPHWTIQGWARSQALVRHSDRQRIEQFLVEVDPGRRSHPSVSELKTWLRYQGGRCSDLLARANDEAAEQILQDVLEDETQRWHRDGRRVRQTGARRGLLQYDDWTGTFSVAVEVEPEWHGLPLDVGEDRPHVPDEFETFLQITPRVSDAQLLEVGVEHALNDSVVLSVGGQDLYVMRDEPRVNGRLQCRTAAPGAVVHVLARQGRIAEVLHALGDSDLHVRRCGSTVDGWSWLEGIRLDSAPARFVAALRLTEPPNHGPALQGGLRISTHAYLTGYEPDVVISGDAEVLLDGSPLRRTPGQQIVSLADECLDPGEHKLVSTAGEATFRSEACFRESARSGDVGWPFGSVDGTYRFMEPARAPQHPALLSGAVLPGVVLPEPLVVRRPPDTQCLVLTESGELLQVWPSTPRWLHEVGLEPAAVDVLDAVRTTASPPVCFVVRHRGGLTRAISVPAGTAQTPGRVETQPRPDLVADLFNGRDWQWVGAPDRRVRNALAQALKQPNRRSERRLRVRHYSSPPAQAVVRQDVVSGSMPDNPYDDILVWLSELEHARASNEAFAHAWEWVCLRYGHVQMADRWQAAARTLAMLGHVERDYQRRQVAAGPATLVALPSAAGLYVLCGARPTRLLERMDDPDDAQPAVAAASGSNVLHVRTPLNPMRRPLGPSVIYVESDSRRRGEVESGLAQLGVALQGQVAVRLLAMQPTLSQSLQNGQRLDMSPSRAPLRRVPTVPGQPRWASQPSDTAPGLYCYRVHGRSVIAWRPANEAPLVGVSLEVGEWLWRERQGETSLLVHDLLGRRLYVPDDAPLPSLVARALALRSGLPPYPATPGGPLPGRHHTHLAYENIDERSAEQVARLLHQRLVTRHGSMRMVR